MPPPAWLKRPTLVGGSNWANPARLGALGLGAFLAWVVAADALNPPRGPSAPARVAALRVDVSTRNAPPPTFSGRGWTYVVATYDSRTLRLYQDARLIASSDATGTPGPSSAPIEIGNLIGGARWTGPMKYVAVYRSALSASQIDSHYQAGLAGWSRFETALRTKPAPAFLWRNRLPAVGFRDPAHPVPSSRFSLEAWVRPANTDNRVVVAQPRAWVLQTDLSGHWRALLFVRRREIDAASKVAP